MKVAVVGATGEVGRKIIDELSSLDIDHLDLYAGKKSVGELISFQNKEIEVEELKQESLKDQYDYVLFSAGGDVSKEFAQIAAKAGSVVIDNSSAFRMDNDIPLIIPEINSHKIKGYKGIIANPNCSTIQMLLALNNVQKQIKIEEINVSTYQAVSGAGNKGIQELINQEKESNQPEHFEKIIHRNIIPKIGDYEENGFTTEEMKMVNETTKIFEDKEIIVIPTAVRVPVVYGHSESITFKISKSTNLQLISDLIANSENVVYDDEIITPLEIQDDKMTYVSRLRQLNDKTFLIWVMANNVRVGAATNAVRIMKKHIELNRDNS
ncbi:MAG: aspartate-semialdehyde dehydrogenase [Thermotogota bacterium]